MTKKYRDINIGIIGGGYMGKAHIIALHAVGATFDTNLRPVPYMIATTTMHGAKQKQEEFGVHHATDCWQDIINDDNIEAVIIASPQDTHKEIALAAFDNYKHVFCEKPLAAHIDDSRAMAMAASKTSYIHMVGFNYIHSPAMQLAKKMIADDAIGEITFMRAEHTEDFFADPLLPGNWRTEGKASGTMGDLAPHIINAAHMLVGDISSLVADIGIVHHQRPTTDNPSQYTTVKNDDHAHILCNFSNGAKGNLYFSRVATGQKSRYCFEIYGTKGALKFDQEDMNILWYFDTRINKEQQGFTRILMNKAHPDYAQLCPFDGHGTGYSEQITTEIRNFLVAIDQKKLLYPNFHDGLKVDEVVYAAFESHDIKKWITL